MHIDLSSHQACVIPPRPHFWATTLRDSSELNHQLRCIHFRSGGHPRSRGDGTLEPGRLSEAVRSRAHGGQHMLGHYLYALHDSSIDLYNDIHTSVLLAPQRRRYRIWHALGGIGLPPSSIPSDDGSLSKNLEPSSRPQDHPLLVGIPLDATSAYFRRHRFCLIATASSATSAVAFADHLTQSGLPLCLLQGSHVQVGHQHRKPGGPPATTRERIVPSAARSDSNWPHLVKVQHTDLPGAHLDKPFRKEPHSPYRALQLA